MLFLSSMLISFGSSTIILSKLIGTSKSVGLDQGEPKSFDHPWVMVLFMFIGMGLSLPLYKLGLGASQKPKPFSPTVFILPSLCDLLGTALTYMSLMLCTMSTFVMLRGSVVVWTAALSSILLGRRFEAHQLVGIGLTMGGLAVTALASVSSDSEAKDPVLGGLLSLSSSFFIALMMVLEEMFVSKYDVPPLLGVGWEGVWGMVMTTAVLVVLQHAPGDQLGSFENSVDAYVQVKNNPSLAMLLALEVLVITGYNGFGVTVGVKLSSAHRVIIDSCKTVVVWGISLGLGWEGLVWSKAGGFVLLAIGTCVYNKIVELPGLRSAKPKTS